MEVTILEYKTTKPYAKNYNPFGVLAEAKIKIQTDWIERFAYGWKSETVDVVKIGVNWYNKETGKEINSSAWYLLEKHIEAKAILKKIKNDK